jgi:hypothetical protein
VAASIIVIEEVRKLIKGRSRAEEPAPAQPAAAAAA